MRVALALRELFVKKCIAVPFDAVKRDLPQANRRAGVEWEVSPQSLVDETYFAPKVEDILHDDSAGSHS